MLKQKTFPKITDEELERLGSLMGDEREAAEPFNRYATFDTIRHFAHAIGDVNPLFTSETYARKTAAETVVAPPSFLFSCFGRGAPEGLKGIHGMWAGARFDMENSIPAGTRIDAKVALTGLTPKTTKFAGRAVLQEHTYTFSDQNAEKLGSVKEWNMRTERDSARKRDKYHYLEQAKYTSEDIQSIFADYELEEIRGSNPRYWEDVVVGEELAHVVKGPLRVTDNIAWKIGWGFRPFAYAHRVAVDLYKKAPAAFIDNEFGIPDIPERVHWDPEFARRVGVPNAYDTGPQRVSWLCQVATNWIGDAGFIRLFWGEVRRFNLVGDTHWLKGKVAGKYVKNDRNLVDLELWGVDQRDETTIRGAAEVELPSKPQ